MIHYYSLNSFINNCTGSVNPYQHRVTERDYLADSFCESKQIIQLAGLAAILNTTQEERELFNRVR